MNRLGILGGMGPLATADLYKKIIVKTDADNDQDNLRIIIDSNAQIPDRTAFIIGSGKSPLPKMKESVDLLVDAGVDLIIMPCNTAHYFFDELQEYSKIRILNMVELTAKHVKNQYSNKSICLLATTGSYKSLIYQNYNESIKIPSESIQGNLMEIIYLVKSNDLEEANIKMLEVLKQLNYEVFILGCTELSSLNVAFNYEGRIFIDPMDILVEEVLKQKNSYSSE